MTEIPDAFPSNGRVFESTRERRFLGLAIETLVHDVSPVGDGEVAERITDYLFGEGQPPEDIPAYVEMEDGLLRLSNPPFLTGGIALSKDDEYVLRAGLDSDLQLLIDPPVWITVRGPLDGVVETFEQILVEIYRTKGRRLEMIDNGAIDPDAFADGEVAVEWTVDDASRPPSLDG